MTTQESFQEQFARVLSMSEDTGETWDLSDNDQAALKSVLLRLVQRDGAATELLDTLRLIVDEMNRAEWASPEHAEEVLLNLINRWAPIGAHAIAKAEGK